jgi:MFS family permease
MVTLFTTRLYLCTVTQMRPTIASYLTFASFGLFWGTWGAALPALREGAGVDDGALGTALLLVGAGALPAMLLTGRAVDRWGARIVGALLIALALAGVLTAALGTGFAMLASGMLLVGATSGASDVAANALAGLAEQRSGRRTITISHAMFSSAVVVGSLGAGALRAAGTDAVLVFAATGSLIAVGGVAALVFGDGPQAASAQAAGATSTRVPVLPFIAVGLVGALAFATENAHQSWSAIFLTDEFSVAAGITAVAPATFAVFAALTRFAAGLFTRVSTGFLLVAGAVVALGGTLLLAGAQTVTMALGGLALAAIGTSVLFPTLLSRAVRDIPAEYRGRATSTVSTTSYIGFLLGPVYVGLLSDAAGLRTAMIGVAALAALFALLAPVVTRHRGSMRRDGTIAV